MRAKLLLLVLSVCLALSAQTRLSIEQLKSFIKSSVQLQHEDRRVAAYLKNIRLQYRLDEETLAEFDRMGAGPRTMEALREVQKGSQSLPDAPTRATAPEAAASAIAPPSPAEQKKVLAEVRGYALNYTRSLPDFICLQVTRRYVDPTGLEFWQRADVITERLSYFEQREEYTVVTINNQPTNLTHDQLGGATSSGEFGSMLKEVFEPETKTEFKWERWARLRGRKMQVFSYYVARENSKWRISYERTQEIVPAYRGLVYVDDATHQVMRLTLEAVEVPLSFPIQQANTTLDYDFTKIGDLEFILPLKAVMRMRQGRLLVKNEAEFRMYRKFGAEATIKFDTPEPLGEEQTTEQPIKP
jgi:hypothetical protein